MISEASVGAEQASTATVYFFRDGQAAPVSRPTPLRGESSIDATALVSALLAGPTPEERAEGLSSPLPPDAESLLVSVTGDEVTVDLHLPFGFLYGELDPERSDAIVEQIAKTLHLLGLRHIHVRAKDERGSMQPLSDFLPSPPASFPPIPSNEDAAPDRLGGAVGRPPATEGDMPGPMPKEAGQPPSFGQGQPQGALSGRTVWLSSGHGWHWSDVLGRWTTQRGNNYGLVEDFSNAEAVNYYLARYLWNAGADVRLVREWAMTEHEVIVDNDDGAPAYVEAGPWRTSLSAGYGGGTYRWVSTSIGSLAATATWTPELPEEGWYAVWVWYLQGDNRSVDARYEIHHAGGVAAVRLSQEVHGQSWRYLGEYYFHAGSAGYVTLLNFSDDPGQAVIADAVRFGGGLGSIAEPGGTSGRPRWEEAGKYWARYQGLPPEYCTADPTCRPLYAEWEMAKGYPGDTEDAVYVSWHTNAGGGTGTESYIHDTHPVAGSVELQARIHIELVNDLKAAWNPQWVDRGRKSADFGEVRELSSIPGVLLEVAFHDTEDPGDADDLREPLFRQIAARAVYQGIVGYYAARQGAAAGPSDPLRAGLLPEPPTRLAARNSGSGQVTLTWASPTCCNGVVGDAATHYKVYQSVDGRAFDNGTMVSDKIFRLSGLPPGTLRFFRVTALNEGGESFPTPVVAVRTPATGENASALIVDGFDRLDQAAMYAERSAPFLGTTQRMFLELMNRYDYAVEHARALEACGLAFDGATNEAVEAGEVFLHDYPMVDWFVGEESVADATLSGAERTLLASFLDGGRRLLISGAEIGYDLVENGRDPAFFRTYLRAEYVGDDADAYAFAGVQGGLFEGQAGRFGDGTGGVYDVDHPERLAAVPDSALALRYAGGTGDGAAVVYRGVFRTVYFGFPLETVADPVVRNALFCAAVGFLLEDVGSAGQACSPRVINPGFEGGRGQSAWQVQNPATRTVLAHRAELPVGVEPHGGDWLAWLGGYTPGVTTTAALTQTLTLPAGDAAVSLTLSWLTYTEIVAPSTTDRLSLIIYDLDGQVLAELMVLPAHTPTTSPDTKAAGGEGWQAAQFDLSRFAGLTVQLSLCAVSRDTAFFVDDVQLVSCGPTGSGEFRGLWVDAYHEGIKSPSQIAELVETARAGNFNALIVQVRRRGDTYYPSLLDPWAADATPGFDALAYLIERAHGAGLEVHAWATTLAIWSGPTPPVASDHTFNLHGPGATGYNYWLMTSRDGLAQTSDQQYYLDPGHPGAVAYTVEIYRELASRYDLDGLHLDRVRYPGQDWGYNAVAVARFQAQTGRDDLPSPQDEQWLQWRRDQVTALVRRVYLSILAINPRLRVSAALSAVGSHPSSQAAWETGTSYTHHLQDWRGWLQEGIIDLALPLNYRVEAGFAEDFDGWIEWEKDHQYGRGVVVGTGLYLNEIKDSMAQWLRVRQLSRLGHQARGLAGYSYATPSAQGTSRRAFVNEAVATVLTQSASTPLLPWKDTPTLGHVAGRVTQARPCLNLDGYSLTLMGPEGRTLRTDGSGWFGAVDLQPGQYVILARTPWLGQDVRVDVRVWAGAVAGVQITLPPCPSQSSATFLPLVTK